MNNSRDTFDELRTFLDGNDPYMTGGHQIIKIRQGNRKVPDWARNDKEIIKVILRSFPAALTDAKQRKRAGRWLRAIYLYYRLQKTYSQVADEMGTTRKSIRSLLQGVKNVARGVRFDGRGKLGAKPRGRPRLN